MNRTMVALAASLALATAAQAQASQASQTARNKEVAIAFYNALVRGDVEAIRRYGRPDYIQHNPAAATGLDGVIAFFGSRPRPATPPPPLEFVRTMAEGDMVMVQRRVPTPTPADPANVRSIIDIFRIKDGQVAEHWDYFEDFAHGNQRGPEAPKNANGVF